MQRLQVQSLLEEITSDMLYGKAKKEREREREREMYVMVFNIYSMCLIRLIWEQKRLVI